MDPIRTERLKSEINRSEGYGGGGGKKEETSGESESVRSSSGCEARGAGDEATKGVPFASAVFVHPRPPSLPK